jgi:uncharacterized protein (TIGR03790 family)
LLSIDWPYTGEYPTVWEASTGTIASREGGIDWQLPADIALYQPEEHFLKAIVSGCSETEAQLTIGWEEADRVVVIYNPALPESQEIAESYAALHSLSDAQLCPIEPSSTTELPASDYPAFLDAVLACVGPHSWYLVPVWGIPLKVQGKIYDIDGGGFLATVSLDALLAYGEQSREATRYDKSPLYQEGSSLNGDYDPYVPFGELRQSLRNPYYLVTRIDGASAEAAGELVERSGEAQALADTGALEGNVYIDGRYGDTPPASDEFGSYESGEWNMWGSRTVFEDLNRWPVIWDGNAEEFGTTPALESCPDALFYTGWYSYYNYNDAFTWTPGAIGAHLDSCSACSLTESTWSAEALKRGITATFGAVNEPYVAGMPEYDQFFLYLTQGASFGEAAYESTRLGLWMMVFVGDPLYRPFPQE